MDFNFDYFTQEDLESFNFFKVPKALFTKEIFKPLKVEEKILRWPRKVGPISRVSVKAYSAISFSFPTPRGRKFLCCIFLSIFYWW